MTIDDIYIYELSQLFDDITDIKARIIKIYGLEDLNVDIELVYGPIKDDKGNNVFGAFYKEENKVKISKQELISFVGNKVCYKYSKLDCSRNNNYIKIFQYYTLYVIAHEIHHAYLYNTNKERYENIKKSDSNKEYKDKELEKLADENAKNYLYSLGNDIAKYTVDLAIGLRTKSYITGKNELETEQENQLKFIEKSLKKIMNES